MRRRWHLVSMALALGPGAAHAQGTTPWVGAMVGVHSGPDPLGPGPEGSLAAGLVLPIWAGRLSPGLSVGGWQAVAADDGESVNLDQPWRSLVRVRVARVRLDLTSRILPADATFNPELSVSPELRRQVVRGTVRAGDATLSDRTVLAWGWGLRMGGGGSIAVGPGRLGLQAGWTLAGLQSDLTGDASTGGFDLSPFYRLER